MENAISAETLIALKELDPESGDDFLKELIVAYLEDSPQKVKEIKKSVQERSAENLHRSAHGLKGSSANMGALTVAKHSAALEVKGKRGSFEGCEELVELLVQAYNAAEQELRAI